MLPNRPYENTSVMFMDNQHHHVQYKFWANDVDNIHTFLANIEKKLYKIWKQEILHFAVLGELFFPVARCAQIKLIFPDNVYLYCVYTEKSYMQEMVKFIHKKAQTLNIFVFI